jgi:hypothetical protein
MNEMALRDDITMAINGASAEEGSNTPDFILAGFLMACLAAFDDAVNARAIWYGRHDVPGGQVLTGKPDTLPTG